MARHVRPRPRRCRRRHGKVELTARGARARPPVGARPCPTPDGSWRHWWSRRERWYGGASAYSPATRLSRHRRGARRGRAETARPRRGRRVGAAGLARPRAPRAGRAPSQGPPVMVSASTAATPPARRRPRPAATRRVAANASVAGRPLGRRPARLAAPPGARSATCRRAGPPATPRDPRRTALHAAAERRPSRPRTLASRAKVSSASCSACAVG